MQKIRKILRAVSEKIALPTNQLLPTTLILYNLADAGPKKVWKEAATGGACNFIKKGL